MSDVAIGAEGAEAAHAHVWEVPGKHVAVSISYEAMDRVLVDGLRGLGMVPRRGAEIGGILLGTVEPRPAEAAVLVRIDGVMPVPCEYAFGPSYILSAKDRESFRNAIAAAAGRAVGYYRTHTRERLNFTEADLSLFGEFFPQPSNVALVVKPRAMRASVAGFFIWEGGSVRDTSYLEFRVQARHGLKRMAKAETAAVNDPPDERTAAQESAAPDIALPAFLQTTPPAGHRPRLRWFSWWIQAPLLAALLLADSLLGYAAARQLNTSLQRGRLQADPYSLDLAVAEYGDNLHLSWNHNAPAVKAARRAALSINDGVLARTLELNLAQLRTGSVIYRRLTPDVKLKLEVFVSDRASVAESRHFVASAPPADASQRAGPGR